MATASCCAAAYSEDTAQSIANPDTADEQLCTCFYLKGNLMLFKRSFLSALDVRN